MDIGDFSENYEKYSKNEKIIFIYNLAYVKSEFISIL
jgi:hypothetical protein